MQRTTIASAGIDPPSTSSGCACNRRSSSDRQLTQLRSQLRRVEGERDRAREIAARLEERLTLVEGALAGLDDSRRRAMGELAVSGA